MLRTRSLPFLFCALQACSSDRASAPTSNPAPSADEPLPASAIQELGQTLDDVVAAGVAPGVTLRLKRPGYAAWQGTAGVSDLAAGTPLRVADRFRAGSILKMAVATAILQLVEHDELSLDAPLTEVLPEAVTSRIPHAEATLVRMLLNHTSGVAELVDDAFTARVLAEPTHVWTLDEELDHIASLSPAFEPGQGWSYSNTNYILLGEILARTTGKPWRSVVRERVFERAGLLESTLPEEGNPLCDGCARGYEPLADALVDLTEIDPSMAGAAGGDALITTPADLTRLLGALTTGQLFDDPGTLDQMLDFTEAQVPEWAQTGYGFGIAHYAFDGTEFVGLYGGTAGFHGFILSEPTSGTIISGYMNVDGDFGAFLVPVLQTLEHVLQADSAR